MALLALRLGHHHHHLGLSAPRDPRLLLRRRLVVASSGAVKAPAAAAVVWFKHDLRVDDHPGLAAAVAAEPRRPVLPLYVFDRRILDGTLLLLRLLAPCSKCLTEPLVLECPGAVGSVCDVFDTMSYGSRGGLIGRLHFGVYCVLSLACPVTWLRFFFLLRLCKI